MVFFYVIYFALVIGDTKLCWSSRTWDKHFPRCFHHYNIEMTPQTQNDWS